MQRNPAKKATVRRGMPYPMHQHPRLHHVLHRVHHPRLYQRRVMRQHPEKPFLDVSGMVSRRTLYGRKYVAG
jgi:hypothetical protein